MSMPSISEQKMVTKTNPPIAIIGGGPGGLVLALTLHRHGIPYTVYEREADAHSRAHLGGMLDLGYDSGQRALRENDLGEAFARNSRPYADTFGMYDFEGNLLFVKDANLDENPLNVRPEIDRSVLRKILLGAIPADTIKWGYNLESVRDLGDGTRELTFTNGSTAVAEILVGADGANSRVRPLVSSVVPIFHGVTGVEISIPPEQTKRPGLEDIITMVGDGSLFTFGEGQVLVSQLNGDGRIRTYAWFTGPADLELPSEPAEARKVLLEEFRDWSPTLRKLIQYCDDHAIYPRPLYRLPTDHKWAHVSGITLVGDAAHFMSPFAGAGVNLAMLDALELGSVLADTIIGGKSVEEREEAIAAWEEERMAAASDFAVIADANVQGIQTESAMGAAKLLYDFMVNAELRRKA